MVRGRALRELTRNPQVDSTQRTPAARPGALSVLEPRLLDALDRPAASR